MPPRKKKKFREIKWEQKMSSKTLDADQELKESILLGMMIEHWEEFNLE